MRNAYRNLFGKTGEKKSLRGPKQSWENNTKMDIKDTGTEGVGWIYMAQDRSMWRVLVKTVMNLHIQ
jgi:hypothetical protein